MNDSYKENLSHKPKDIKVLLLSNNPKSKNDTIVDMFLGFKYGMTKNEFEKQKKSPIISKKTIY